jgi:general secretion pathway protein G
MKTRKGGFTLVELLLVITLISILSGMMLLSTGSATDLAEVVKVINDLRNLKSAALLYYGDNNEWPTNSNVTALNYYSDRPIVKSNASDTVGRYVVTIGNGYSDSADPNAVRVNIGLELSGAAAEAGVKKRLGDKAAASGLLNAINNAATSYNGSGDWVYMNMR